MVLAILDICAALERLIELDSTSITMRSKSSSLAWADAIADARALLAQPVTEGPTDEELDALERQHWESTGVVSEALQKEELFNYRTFARFVLARWGHPPVAEPGQAEPMPKQLTLNQPIK